ncbi:hypothetical protein RUND412_008433 [Rhizina undulata]
MSEFIGSRISLISRSDIRYVGILHDINSDNHTVALEQVVSHGTEGRCADPSKEIPASDNVYEYIVFRGGDVKDLRIEEPAPPKPKPPIPDDPAILGSSSRPPPYAPQNPQQHPYQQPPPMPYFYPAQQQAGRYGGPFQGQQFYGNYPPPMQPGMGQVPPNFPNQPPQPQQMPPQLNQQQQQPPQPVGQIQNRQPPPAPIGPAANRQQQPQPIGRNAQPQQQIQTPQTPAQPQAPAEQSTSTKAASDKPAQAATGKESAPKAPKAAAAPAQIKSEGGASLAPPTTSAPPVQTPTKAPTGPKARGGVIPALPLLPSPNRQPVTPVLPQSSQAASATNTSATTTVNGTAPKPTASVAPKETSSAVQDLADKVNQLALKTIAPTGNVNASNAVMTPATNAQTVSHESRPPRQPGAHAHGNRGHGARGGRGNAQGRKVDVPATPFDFEESNAKFNKEDLVKEVIAAGDEDNKPHMGNGSVAGDEDIPSNPSEGFYNRGKSFFDNISCENKERAEAKDGEKRGGAVWRGEEQKKNLETFGQGSVDGGFGAYGRQGWRGGRGRGGRNMYRGRGGYGGGYPRTGGYRGQHGNTVASGN